MNKSFRRYDIDWIRVLAFDILILYHVGLFFVPWHYHINNNETVDWMSYPMFFIHQWRIPILFVISGMGTSFALTNKTGGGYIKERFTRLFIPLIVGILVVVSPQVYIERFTQGKATGSFFEFFPSFFDGVYPEGNFSWHHLWFLPYLLLMSVLFTPLFLRLKNDNNKVVILLSKIFDRSPWSLFIFSIPLLIVEILLRSSFPITHTLLGDWYALTSYSILFISGFILISIGNSFWKAIDKIKRYTLIFGVIFFLILLSQWDNVEGNIFMSIIRVLNMWCWILTVFAYSSKYLNKESKVLRYRNQAVYPFYILHQTIILFIGYLLMDNSLHYMWKFIIMVIGTFGSSWLIFEFLIKRIKIIRPLFGMKVTKSSNTSSSPSK